SQTCGLPFRLGLHRRFALVGALDFGLPGCPPGYYRSVLVTRASEARSIPHLISEGRCVINAPDSQSGCWALRQFGCLEAGSLVSGGHAASLRMLREGQADLAAIDAQTWRLLRRQTGQITGLKIAALSRPTPGLPLITTHARDLPAFRAALPAAIQACPSPTRLRLGLRGFVALEPAAYLTET
ncbi:MAG: PhnD/SsuA/transferrin family substrate-binding protein, partial [Pseudomonadota bacterium]